MSHFVVGVITRPDQDIDELLAPYMENCCGTPDHKYMEFYEDEDYEVDEVTGKHGYWQNPNAKWDWYEIGGRWDGYFKGKNSIPVADYPTEPNHNSYEDALKEWDKWTDYLDEGANSALDKTLPWELRMYRPSVILKRYHTREDYARIKSTPWMRAVVTPDGEWHEVGSMGWWGMSTEEFNAVDDWVRHFKTRFIDPYTKGGFTITAVDCHI